MATLDNTMPTMLEIVQQLDKNRDLLPFANLLAKKKPMLQDAPMYECNDGTGHKASVVTSIPVANTVAVNEHVPNTKGTFAQIRDTTSIIADYSTVAVLAANMARDPAAFRMRQAKTHLEGMANKFEELMVYGNEATNPKDFTGIIPRIASASQPNFIGSAASPDASDNLSMLLVGWGENTVHCIYPQGSTAGLHMRDLGEMTETSATGNLQVYKSYFEMQVGLHVADWRFIQRIMIDAENLTASGSTGPMIDLLLVEALNNIPYRDGVKLVFYMNKTAMLYADFQAMSKTNMAWQSIKDAQGMPVTEFRGIPVHRCDMLLDTETL